MASFVTPLFRCFEPGLIADGSIGGFNLTRNPLHVAEHMRMQCGPYAGRLQADSVTEMPLFSLMTPISVHPNVAQEHVTILREAQCFRTSARIWAVSLEFTLLGFAQK